MATATTLTLTFALGTPSGPKKMITSTCTDVTTNFVAFPDGSSYITLGGGKDAYLTDAMFGSATGDCTLAELFIGGTSTNIKLVKAAHGPASVGRPIQGAPVRIPAGASIGIKQLT
jgi:hypothetical protein